MSTDQSLPPAVDEAVPEISEADWDDLNELFQMLNKSCPPKLYHYTTADGFLKILDSKVLFASHAYALNDLTEGSFASAILNEELEALEREGYAGLGNVARTFLHDIGYEFFSACFSETGSSLPMWMQYADSGTGYSLGFDASRIANPRQILTQLLPVHYGADAAMKIAKQITAWLRRKLPASQFAQCIAAGQLSGHAQSVFTKFCIALAFLSHSSKHEDFSYEREWRWIAPVFMPNEKERKQTQFKARKGLLAAYVECPMPKTAAGALDVLEVGYGPSLRDESVDFFLRLRLYCYGAPGAQVIEPSTKLR